MNDITITVFGSGYVGLTTAALTAAAGMTTYLVDPNEARLVSVRAGKSFFYEMGLDVLVKNGIDTGLLRPTSEYAEAVRASDIVISAVGTPDNPDGSTNLRYVLSAATEAARYLRPDAAYVQKSTVPVATGRRIEALFAAANCTAAYVSNPEFLREGTALADSLWYDRLVVGGSDAQACEKVVKLYERITAQREYIARLSGLVAPEVVPAGVVIETGLESAELIKVTANAFLALKISFANSIALLADKTDADIGDVLAGVGADRRIGRAFLQAGRGYGGGCFPKDVSGLIATGLEHGVDLEIMHATQALNEAMPGQIVEKLQDSLGGSLAGKTVAVLGLAFKAGTSDTRRSSGVAIANLLVRSGAIVQAYDPEAMSEATPSLHTSISLHSTAEECLNGVSAVVIATDWPEFVNYNWSTYGAHNPGAVLFDGMLCLSPVRIRPLPQITQAVYSPDCGLMV